MNIYLEGALRYYWKKIGKDASDLIAELGTDRSNKILRNSLILSI